MMAIRWNLLVEALIIVVVGGLIIEVIDILFKLIIKSIKGDNNDR